MISIALSVHFELFEALTAFGHTHERWEIDELFTLFIIGTAGGLIYSVRRVRELGHELQRREQAEARVRHMAMHDALTGLPNRRSLSCRTDALLHAGEGLAYLAVDLDRFKPVNDLYGHAIGDGLLRHVGTVLVAAGGTGAIAARLGGDEFALVLPGAAHEDVIRVAENVLRALRAPVEIEGKTCQIGASIGIAMAPEDGDTVELLMRRSDVALYRAKSDGRDCYHVFEHGMDKHVRDRAKLQAELNHALRTGEVRPHYHALVDLASGELTGFEILARWTHPTRGEVPPDLFVALAEDLGVITEMSCQLLRQACLDARAWPTHLTLALNISPLQLRDPWLAERLLQVLVETGFPPERLEIEITEEALISDIEAARTIVTSLKHQGVHVVLDDFGTGYSSLHYLRDLPFDALKIDRSFLIGKDDDAEALSVVSAIIGLARSLNVSVTAEGVETEANRDLLRSMGCSQAQGFLYGEPADACHIAAMLGLDPADAADEAPSTTSARRIG